MQNDMTKTLTDITISHITAYAMLVKTLENQGHLDTSGLVNILQEAVEGDSFNQSVRDHLNNYLQFVKADEQPLN